MMVQLLCLWFGLLQVNGSVNSIVAVCVPTIMKSFWPKYWGGSSPPSYVPDSRLWMEPWRCGQTDRAEVEPSGG